MSDSQGLPKPDAEISDYEWRVTPHPVKAIIAQLQKLIQQKQERLERLKRENKWLHHQLEQILERPNRPYTPPLPEILLWATMGIILTTVGSFTPAYMLAAPWSWWTKGLAVKTLGVSFQVGAVLLIACLGGKNAALLAQTSYVILGLAGIPLFAQGGGFDYLLQPNFGYLIGFILGGTLCGWLAFQRLVRFSNLIASCLAGLMVIHLVGIVYLTGVYWFTDLGSGLNSWLQALSAYTVQPFPGQIAVVCAVSIVAFVMRKAMFT